MSEAGTAAATTASTAPAAPTAAPEAPQSPLPGPRERIAWRWTVFAVLTIGGFDLAGAYHRDHLRELALAGERDAARARAAAVARQRWARAFAVRVTDGDGRPLEGAIVRRRGLAHHRGGLSAWRLTGPEWLPPHHAAPVAAGGAATPTPPSGVVRYPDAAGEAVEIVVSARDRAVATRRLAVPALRDVPELPWLEVVLGRGHALEVRLAGGGPEPFRIAVRPRQHADPRSVIEAAAGGRVAGIPEGTWRPVAVRADGVAFTGPPVRVPEWAAADLDVAGSGRLAITVLRADGTPLVNAHVAVRIDRPDGGEVAFGRVTDASGALVQDRLPAGRVAAVITWDRAWVEIPVPAEAFLRAEGESSLPLVLPALPRTVPPRVTPGMPATWGPVRVRVLGSDGAPAPDADVLLVPSGRRTEPLDAASPLVVRATPAPGGPPGTREARIPAGAAYDVFARAAGTGLGVRSGVRAGEGSEGADPIVVVVPAERVLRGTVLRADGAPVAGATVVVRAPDDGPPHAMPAGSAFDATHGEPYRVPTGPDGGFRVGGLAAAPYEVRVEEAGVEVARAELAPGDLPHRVTLPR